MSEKQMALLGETNGIKWYWAEPGKFEAPGVYYWDGKENVLVQPAASAEPLVRYCPGCGSIGPVEGKYRDCCPDGNESRMIPQGLAEKCQATFRIAIRDMLAGQTASDTAPVAAQPSVDTVTASEAVYAFAAWLTTRSQPVTLSSTHEASIAAELVSLFVTGQGWEQPRDDYTDRLRTYPSEAPTPPADGQTLDHPLGWKISYTDAEGVRQSVLCGHNSVGDYRDIDPMASSIALGPFMTTADDLSQGGAQTSPKGPETRIGTDIKGGAQLDDAWGRAASLVKKDSS